MIKKRLDKDKNVPYEYDKVIFEKKKGDKSHNICGAEIIHYDNASEMISHSLTGKSKKYLEDRDGDDWTFGTEFPDLDSTTEALRSGECSNKTLKQISKYRDILLSMDGIEESMRRAVSFKRRRKFSDSGSELDIDRVLSGDPEHWQSMTKGKKENVVRLAVNFSVSCGHTEKQLNRLAALTTVAVDMLQRCGLSVEVLALCVAHNVTRTFEHKDKRVEVGSYEQGFTFKLKSASEKLDVSRVACIGIPGLYRSYGFTNWINFLDGNASSGLGSGLETTQNLKDLLNIKNLLEVKWVKNGKEKAFLSKLLKSVTQNQLLETN
jgi:hypothetical protein